MEGDLTAAAHQWQTEGWALVDGLVPTDDIDAVQPDLEHLFAADTFDDYNRAAKFGDGAPDGKGFRASQFDGMRGFPQAGCAALNDLFVHRREAAQRAYERGLHAPIRHEEQCDEGGRPAAHPEEGTTLLAGEIADRCAPGRRESGPRRRLCNGHGEEE